jgi:multidrug efflux pump subunit AcrA (membrane-fusion protein)
MAIASLITPHNVAIGWWRICLVAVQTIALKAETIEERSEFVANLQSRRSVILRPRTQGQITRILVTPGQWVSAGTALIQVDPSEQQAVVNSAHASVASAQANVDNANAVLRSLQAERCNASLKLVV